MEIDLTEVLRRALVAQPVLLSAESAPSHAAVAAIVRQQGEPEVLFIQRAEHPLDPWSGHMAFPGGRVDPGDRDEQAAAERETEEEIAVRLAECSTLIGRLDDVQARARGGLLPLAISPFVYWMHSPVDVGLSSEVQQVVWIPLLALFDPRMRKTLEYSSDGQVWTLPSVCFQDKVVWGLTLRILVDLLGRLIDAGIEPWVRERLELTADEPLLPDFDLIRR